jgi:hypothetical protein
MLPHNPLEIQAPVSVKQELRDHRAALLAICLIALAVHLILCYAWPLFAIRSVGAQVINYYVNLVYFDQPVDYHLIAYREPLAPLLHGLTLSISPTLNVATQVVLAVTAVAGVFLIGLPWGRLVAWCASLLYLLDIPLQLQFHQISSEGLATWFLIVSLVILRYALQKPGSRTWALFGLAVGLSGLTRPANLGFIVLGAALFLVRQPTRRKLKWAAVMVGVMVLTVAPWIVYKGVRYGMWELSHPDVEPFYRLAYDTGLIEPNNGPASRQLADLIQEHLLSQPEYVAHGITLNQFLRLDKSEEDKRNTYDSNPFNQDVAYSVDLVEGWDTHYNLLRRAGIEALKVNPGLYASAYLNRMTDVMFSPDEITAFVPATFDMFVRRPDQMPPIYRISISHPNNVPEPSDEGLQRRADLVLGLLAPLKTVHRHPDVAQVILDGWQIAWPPLAVVYSLALIGLVWNRGTSLAYLVLANLAAVGLCLFSALFDNLARLREPVEVVFILTASIGAAGLIAWVMGRIRQLRAPRHPR